MKKMIVALLFLFLMFNDASTTEPANVNVSMDYWGYSFLDRMEARGIIKSFELRVKPVSRRVFADLLVEIEHYDRQHSQQLGRIDLALLEQLKADFIDESTFSVSISERHLGRWQEEKSRFYFDLYGKQSIISNRGQQYQPAELLSETTVGGILRGSISNTVGICLNARNALIRGQKEQREENFDPSKGSPTVISGSNVYQDQALAYWTWQSRPLRVELGRDEFSWGPGYRSGLSISQNMPPAELVRLSTTFKRWKFTFIHAFLRSGLGSKYLAGHRLDVMLKPGLYLGATETTIYGKRDVEFAYLNPIMPYHIAQHHLGDKDNKTMSLDLTCNLLTGSKLYGEYFIDDMTSTASFTHFFGNKFAFLLGGCWVEPLRLRNLDLHIEYAHVEPFVYSHYDSINIYTHYDQIIGHRLGPNSDNLYLQADYRLHRDFSINFFLEQQRKGEGNADTQSRPKEGVEKQFLQGVVESKKIAGIKLTEQIRRDLFVSVQYAYADLRNVNRQPGKNSFDHLARFELNFNY
jgi:hypothetical protein